jgi:hypothetical protein
VPRPFFAGKTKSSAISRVARSGNKRYAIPQLELRDPATSVVQTRNFVSFVVAVDLALLQAKAPAQLAFLL